MTRQVEVEEEQHAYFHCNYLKRQSYTVKTGLFSVSFPQTVSLQITDVLNKYLGKTLFVY